VELKPLGSEGSHRQRSDVEDSSLSDQAIFDRLEREIAFRSVATRLVQR